MTLNEIVMKAIRESLRRTKGNKTQAARELGIGVRTLRKWAYRINGQDERKVGRIQVRSKVKAEE